MTASTAALTLRADNNRSLACTLDDRHWRVRGLDKQLSAERLRVNLLVERRELVHVDTLDLYVARQRKMFIKEAAAELYCDEAVIKQDVGRLLLELEEPKQTATIHERERRSRVPKGRQAVATGVSPWMAWARMVVSPGGVTGTRARTSPVVPSGLARLGGANHHPWARAHGYILSPLRG